jgi:hypothetical protein
MEIALLRTVPVGDAVEISTNVDRGVAWLRVLRKAGTAQTFTGPDDPAAARAIDLPIEIAAQHRLFPSMLDFDLTGEASYTYQAYGYRPPHWLSSAPREIAVVPSAELISPDPHDMLMRRIEAGLRTEVAAGRLHPPTGKIPVFSSPPMTQHTPFPVVTVHVDADIPIERAIGEHTAPDRVVDPTSPDGDGAGAYWEEQEGWLSKWTLSVLGWSLNPDERNALRKSLKHLVLGNLPIFSQAGMLACDFSQRDTEDFERDVPLYITNGTFTCVAPASLAGRTAIIDTVEAEHID